LASEPAGTVARSFYRQTGFMQTSSLVRQVGAVAEFPAFVDRLTWLGRVGRRIQDGAQMIELLSEHVGKKQ